MCVVVMAMVGGMGTGMELVLGKHAGQSQVVVVCREMPDNFQSVWGIH